MNLLIKSIFIILVLNYNTIQSNGFPQNLFGGFPGSNLFSNPLNAKPPSPINTVFNFFARPKTSVESPNFEDNNLKNVPNINKRVNEVAANDIGKEVFVDKKANKLNENLLNNAILNNVTPQYNIAPSPTTTIFSTDWTTETTTEDIETTTFEENDLANRSGVSSQVVASLLG